MTTTEQFQGVPELIPAVEPIEAAALTVAAPVRPKGRRSRRRCKEGGSCYQRPGSVYWWIKWYDAKGRPRRESTRRTVYDEARGILREKLAAVSRGEPIAPNPGRITVGALLTDLENDYRANAQVLTAIRPNVARLRAAFGTLRAVDVTTADLRAYVAEHQRSETNKEGLSNGTLNRDLSALRRAYALASQDTPPKLTYRPHFPRLREGAPRAGFFERAQFEAVSRHLPGDVGPTIRFAYATGWRVRSEVLPLTWAQVSFPEGAVRLEPGTTKNDEPREFPMTADLRAILEGQRAMTDQLQRQTGRIIPWVFHRRGARIRDFRGAWATACKLAGCPGRIPHDFRRTAVRNLVRAGVPERVAMQLTGHKTRSVFERYNIVSPGDLRAAAALLDQHGASAHYLAQSAGTVTVLEGMEGRRGRG
jgi:integrase